MSGVTKLLGGVVLPAGLQWPQEGHSLGRGTVARLDLAGRPWVWTAPALRRVTLTALEDMGWFPEATAQALLAMAALPGEWMLLWGDGAWRVVFDFESGPAVELAPVSPGCGWWIGSVRLLFLEEF